MKAFLEEFQHLKIQLEAIKLATRNFDKGNVIGKGGFGLVYVGVLCHSKGQGTVAFKRLDRCYGQGDPEFWKEILILSRYTNENLIPLLGFCDMDGEKIVVYEHASHGSLDHHLSSTTLTWKQRLKICLGAAKGLSYLHDPNETQQRVLHRDIKSSNILLDDNWNAKVSDMGLSKIGPANQKHTFVVSNVVGTLGYIDPMYMQTGILTKESDVYSFGVVLFEVLCGRLCYECKNGRICTLANSWKKNYKRKKLDEIVIQDLKKDMDPNSLKTFSDIAYHCLKKSREKRPEMYQVVEQLEMALRFQEIFEDVEPNYEEISKSAVPPLQKKSKEELKMLLSKGIFVNEGKTWFWLNKNGEKCEMISAAECFIPLQFQAPKNANNGRNKSRFAVGYHIPYCSKFKTHVKTKFLSPHITYVVNLVFDKSDNWNDYMDLSYTMAGETKSWTSYCIDKRDDGWLMAELYHFTSDTRNVDLEITFECRYPLAVEGIEFQPLERVEHQVFQDKEVDMQTISYSDIYCEQKLPNDIEDIIKWSKDCTQSTTNRDIYYFLCKGFLIKNGREWVSLAKNGKKCHMLPATVALRKSEWSWRSFPESRFEEVAFDPHGNFSINCSSKILSPQTNYASYLVYKLQQNHSGFEPPVKVSDVFYGGFYENQSWYIYLLSPQTPIIRPKVSQHTHNPLNRPNIKRLPQQRDDGWMEVLLWECGTGNSMGWISMKLELALAGNKSREGLIVQGIEFKPV